MKPEPSRRPRRPYSPPKVTRVVVRLDEAVLSTCKTTGVNRAGGGCTQVEPPCVAQGS